MKGVFEPGLLVFKDSIFFFHQSRIQARAECLPPSLTPSDPRLSPSRCCACLLIPDRQIGVKGSLVLYLLQVVALGPQRLECRNLLCRLQAEVPQGARTCLQSNGASCSLTLLHPSRCSCVREWDRSMGNLPAQLPQTGNSSELISFFHCQVNFSLQAIKYPCVLYY